MSVDREVYYGRPRSDKDCRSQLKKNVTDEFSTVLKNCVIYAPKLIAETLN